MTQNVLSSGKRSFYECMAQLATPFTRKCVKASECMDFMHMQLHARLGSSKPGPTAVFVLNRASSTLYPLLLCADPFVHCCKRPRLHAFHSRGLSDKYLLRYSANPDQTAHRERHRQFQLLPNHVKRDCLSQPSTTPPPLQHAPPHFPCFSLRDSVLCSPSHHSLFHQSWVLYIAPLVCSTQRTYICVRLQCA